MCCWGKQALNDDEEQESILGDAAELSGDVQGHVVTLQEAKQWTLRDIMRMRQVIASGLGFGSLLILRPHSLCVANPILSVALLVTIF